MTSIVYLQALDDKTGATGRVVCTEDLDGDMKRIFEAVYGKSFGAVRWSAGVPNVDKVVVWQATPLQGSEQYWLNLSYSEGRVWS